MINSSAFNYVNVLDKAADACWTRNSLLANNIANVSTPNYKRQDVSFESELSTALKSNTVLDQAVNNMNLDSITPSVYTDQSHYSYRTDGNNVDIDVEEANYAENQIKYNAVLDSITQEFQRITTVLNSVR
ncbi:MAG: flagellar basal body rod protein FlgB [bacterium]|nr:flagellar basal body rod protein FlgB [bacterium]